LSNGVSTGLSRLLLHADHFQHCEEFFLQQRYLEKRATWKLEVGFESRIYPAPFCRMFILPIPPFGGKRLHSVSLPYSIATKEEMMFQTSGWNGVRTFEIGLNLGGVWRG